VTDLLELTAELVDIPSVSHHEEAIADELQGRLERAPWLGVRRIGDNVVARTGLHRDLRLVIAGHTDTVPANGNERARIEGDTLWGLGSTDMKSGLAVMLDLALTVGEPAVDVTYVFYVAEEVEARHNGLGALFETAPELLAGDVALLGEPTGGAVEAGCQGSLRVDVTLAGERAHTARPWMGRNAIHRLGGLLTALDSYVERKPVIDDCEYREALQAVGVTGGVAGNVVPDRAVLTLNHRFAPDRTATEAAEHVRAFVEAATGSGAAGGPVDGFEVVDVAEGAAPGLGHPLLRALIDRNRLPVRAKLGWTDVARFAAHGVPAANFGPGDPTLAHTADERVERSTIESVHTALRDLLVSGV
jgi:succinyl-diaminopimelate desuccinylase